MSTYDNVFDVAARLFAEKGYDGVSVREITQEAGANLGAVTYYFGSKESLFNTIVLKKIQPLKDIGRKVAASDLSPGEKLAALLQETSLHVLNRDPSLKAFFAESMQGGLRLPEDSKQAILERNRLIEGILQEGIERGDFRACDTEHATWVFFGMLVPYVLHQPLIHPEWRTAPYPESFVKEIVDTALDLYFNGLLKERAV